VAALLQQSSKNADVVIMPGRWNQAVQQSPLLRKLIALDSNDLTVERPPRLITSGAVNDDDNNNTNQHQQQKRWSHQHSRNPKGYWSLQILVQELYEYVDSYRDEHNRPAVWMPRPSELAAAGRDDLRQALNRYGGSRRVGRTAGMVPYREWYYFEGQLELLLELKTYLDAHCGSDYSTFPTVSAIQRTPGYEQLHALIQYFGGRKFLAARLGMNSTKQKATSSNSSSSSTNHPQRNSNTANHRHHRSSNDSGNTTIMRFGDFDLVFAIRLLYFVRRDHLKRSPPLSNPVLAMPSRSKLLAAAAKENDDEGVWLDQKIDQFGGYENVARRLGLALFAS